MRGIMISNIQGDRRFKFCQCSKCNIVAQCTPSFDFYVKPSCNLLLCEKCFRAGEKY